MKDADIRALIDSLTWTFAKTYADKSPHEYAIVKIGDKHRDEVVEFMKHIFDHGELRPYFGHPFMVYKIDGRIYWSIEGTDKEKLTEEDCILNRSLESNADTVYGKTNS